MAYDKFVHVRSKFVHVGSTIKNTDKAHAGYMYISVYVIA